MSGRRRAMQAPPRLQTFRLLTIVLAITPLAAREAYVNNSEVTDLKVFIEAVHLTSDNENDLINVTSLNEESAMKLNVSANESTTNGTTFRNVPTINSTDSGSKNKQFLYEGLIFPILSSLTVVGNVINVIVFTSRKMTKSPANTLLLGLAVSEGLMGFCFTVEKIMSTYCPICSKTGLHVLSKLGDLFFYSANWITVSISVFRCIVVSMPLQSRYICTQNRALIAIIVCVIANAMKEIPYWVNDFGIQFYSDLKVIEPINQAIGRIIPCVIVLGTTLLSVCKVSNINILV